MKNGRLRGSERHCAAWARSLRRPSLSHYPLSPPPPLLCAATRCTSACSSLSRSTLTAAATALVGSSSAAAPAPAASRRGRLPAPRLHLRSLRTDDTALACCCSSACSMDPAGTCFEFRVTRPHAKFLSVCTVNTVSLLDPLVDSSAGCVEQLAFPGYASLKGVITREGRSPPQRTRKGVCARTRASMRGRMTPTRWAVLLLRSRRCARRQCRVR